MHLRHFLAFTLLASVTAACRPAATPVVEMETTTPSSQPTVAQSPLSPPATPEPTEPGLGETPLAGPSSSPIATPSDSSADALAAATAYLADELNTALRELQPVLVEPTEWPDASLGCPEVGEAYEQSVTPGFRIVLMIDGKEYELHTDQSARQVVICEHKLKKEADVAVEHLAAELGISAQGIEVLSIARYEWPDASMGCREPGKTYAQVVTQGYGIVLRALGQKYEVHTDLEGRTAVTCEPES